jgi:hypothetical protein
MGNNARLTVCPPPPQSFLDEVAPEGSEDATMFGCGSPSSSSGEPGAPGT